MAAPTVDTAGVPGIDGQDDHSAPAQADVDLQALIEELRAIEDAESGAGEPRGAASSAVEGDVAPSTSSSASEPTIELLEAGDADAEFVVLAAAMPAPVLLPAAAHDDGVARVPPGVAEGRSTTAGTTEVPAAQPVPAPATSSADATRTLSAPAAPLTGEPAVVGLPRQKQGTVKPAEPSVASPSQPDRRRRKRPGARRRGPQPTEAQPAPPASAAPVLPPVAATPAPPTAEAAPALASPQMQQRKANTSGREAWSVVAVRPDAIPPARAGEIPAVAASASMPAPESRADADGERSVTPEASADFDASLPSYAPWLTGDPLPPGAAEATPLAVAPGDATETDRASVYAPDPVAPAHHSDHSESRGRTRRAGCAGLGVHPDSRAAAARRRSGA